MNNQQGKAEHTPAPHIRIARMVPSCEMSQEQRDANARLIHAAPDLLAALEAYVKACRCRGTGRYESDCTLCGDSTYDHNCNDKECDCERPNCLAGRAALAKAKGVRSGDDE